MKVRSMFRRHLSVGTEAGGTNEIATFVFQLSFDALRAGKESPEGCHPPAMLLIIRTMADVECGLRETFTSRKL